MWSTLSLLLALLCSVQRCAEGQTLLVAHNNDVLQLDLEKNSSSAVVSADSPVVAFDVHPTWRHVYWATDYRIFRTPLYDLNTTAVVAVTGRVGSVAVDWVHHAVYWTDLTRGLVEAAHTDGRGRRVVVESHYVLGALALDPSRGKLFWIEYIKGAGGEVAQINFSNTFGTSITTIYVSKNIQNGSPLELDVVYKTVKFYQKDENRRELWEIGYAGREPHVKLYTVDQPPVTSLRFTTEAVYYANSEGLYAGLWAKKHIMLVFENNTNSDDFQIPDPYFQLVNEKLVNVRQIRELSDEPEASRTDACTHHLCEQECYLGSPGVPTALCECGFGFRLKDDDRSCFERGYLLYSTATTFERVAFDGKKHTVLYNESAVNIQSFDIHVESGFLFWSDLSTRTIYRAPVDLPTRAQAIVEDVAAYGVAIDWLHDHIYWTDDNQITVGSLDGRKRVVLSASLDAPAQLAVDPINRYIFWAECGKSLSLRRAGLALELFGFTKVADDVACGASLAVVPSSRTLYWLDWSGSLNACGYDGSQRTQLVSESMLAMVALDRGVLWLSNDEAVAVNAISEDPLFQMSLKSITDKPTGLTIVKRRRTDEQNVCEDMDCCGLCLPTSDDNIPNCFFPNVKQPSTDCSTNSENTTEDKSAKGYFEIVEIKAFSAVLRCKGTLLRYPFLHPFIQITEVDSLVPRDQAVRTYRIVRVDNKTLPFTVDALNPATSYSVTVRNRVTRASASLEVHTAPPPLALRRLPVVMVPGLSLPLAWRSQGVHLYSPNAWEDLFQREFMLLLVSKKQYYLSSSFDVAEPILRLAKKEINDFFMVLKYYKSEEEFDDDPEMYLGNVPWGEELRLAMVQVTEYRGSYNLDLVYSEPFKLPDHRWITLLENILQEQRSKERAA